MTASEIISKIKKVTATKFKSFWTHLPARVMLATAIASVCLQTAFAQDAKDKDDSPLGMMVCRGANLVTEFIDDADGTFVYRKEVVGWQQGHERTYQTIKLKNGKPDVSTSRNGDTCTLTMNFARTKKVFQFKLCNRSEKSTVKCGGLRSAQEVSKSALAANDLLRKCDFMSAGIPGKGPSFRTALSKCEVPAPTTKKNKKRTPLACKNTTSGLKVQPYTCNYVESVQGARALSLVDTSSTGAKFCSPRQTQKVCTAKVRCRWNNQVSWQGQPKVFDNYIFCPARANRCDMTAMDCFTNNELYFPNAEKEASFHEGLREQYDVKDWSGSAQ